MELIPFSFCDYFTPSAEILACWNGKQLRHKKISHTYLLAHSYMNMHNQSPRTKEYSSPYCVWTNFFIILFIEAESLTKAIDIARDSILLIIKV